MNIEKIAKTIGADVNEDFACGIAAFVKQAELDSGESAEFVEACGQAKLAMEKQAQATESFEAGVLKFAAEADLDQDELKQFIGACQHFAQA